MNIQKRALIAAVALAVLSSSGAARAEPAPVAVKDSSFRDANGMRVQQLSAIVDAPVAEVWKAFATDAGFTRWAVPVTHITMENGGMMESSYSLSAKVGDPENIKNRILAFVPEHLLVIHNEHVPKGAPFDPVFIDRIRTIIELDPLPDGRTMVVISQVGYGSGTGFDSMYDHFRAGNAEELASLAQSFHTGPVDWKAEAAKMEASVHKAPQ